MFLCFFQIQRAALPSGMMWIVWRNAEPLHPREMSVSSCPAIQSVYCKTVGTPNQPHAAFSLSQNLGSRDGANIVLYGLPREPDIQVLIVVIRQIFYVLLWLRAHMHTFLWKFTHLAPNYAFHELPQSMIYQIFAEIKPRKMFNSKSKKLNKHEGDIHADQKSFLPQISF